jgi:hypothetical protein
LVPASDGGDDFIGIGGPDEGVGIIVGFAEEAVDGGLETLGILNRTLPSGFIL